MFLRARPKNYDRAARLTENLFGDRAEKQLAHAPSSVCADDEEIGSFSPDDLLQFRPQLAVPNDEFVLNASKDAGSNERVLQLRRLARYCLFTGSNGTRTGDRQTQRGHYVRQAKS
jgi:hypothetical protein